MAAPVDWPGERGNLSQTYRVPGENRSPRSVAQLPDADRRPCACSLSYCSPMVPRYDGAYTRLILGGGTVKAEMERKKSNESGDRPRTNALAASAHHRDDAGRPLLVFADLLRACG